MARIIPDPQHEKAEWMKNLAAAVAANPAGYFIDPSTAALLTAKVDAFVAALAVATEPSTRTSPTIAAKDFAEEAARVICRGVIAAIRPNPQISDTMKVAAGVPPLSPRRTPVPRPSARPGVDIVSVFGRVVTVRIRDTATPGKRGKPEGARSAWVYTFIGNDYPSDPSLWRFYGAATRATYPITFDHALPGGTQVWVRAAWVNAKGQAGPMSAPMTTNLQGGGTSAADLKAAA